MSGKSSEFNPLRQMNGERSRERFLGMNQRASTFKACIAALLRSNMSGNCYKAENPKKPVDPATRPVGVKA